MPLTPALRRTLHGSGLLAATLLSGTPALAQASEAEHFRVADGNGEGMDTHLFRPAVDSKGLIGVNGSSVLGAWDWSVGMVLDYANTLMRASSAATGAESLVDDSFQGTFGANLGLLNRLELGGSASFVLMSGSSASALGPTGKTYAVAPLAEQGMSTAEGHLKVRLTRVEDGPGLAILLQAGAPIGDTPRQLGADPGMWYWPQAIGEVQLGREKEVTLALNLGYRGHTGKNPTFGSVADGKAQLVEGELQYGGLVTGDLGVGWRVAESLALVLETHANYLAGGSSDSGQRFNQEYLGGLKVFYEKNSYLTLAGGSRIYARGFESPDWMMVFGIVYEPSIGDLDRDNYKDDDDTCPNDPEDFDGFNDADGCPEPDNDNDGILDVDDRCPDIAEDRDGDQDFDGCPEGSDGDRDGDGILDSRDKCPDDPEDRDAFEDKDGCPDLDNDKDTIPDTKDECPLDPEDRDAFEDEDGCPDPDNDHDQILDAGDQCPNEPETYNGTDDEDGCPDKGRVVVDGDEIRILDQVLFETNSAKILPASDPILAAVTTLLEHHPDFLLVEVGGHADERSDDRYNATLTKQRAAAVVDALVARGIARDRFVSQGYGEYCPLDAGHGEQAWAKNRRVEFKVVRTEDGDTTVARGCDVARARGVLPPPLPAREE